MDIMKTLESIIPIKRAQMRLLILFQNEKQQNQFKDTFESKYKGEFTTEEVKDQSPDQFQLQCVVEPHLFRGINDIFNGSKADK